MKFLSALGGKPNGDNGFIFDMRSIILLVIFCLTVAFSASALVFQASTLPKKVDKNASDIVVIKEHLSYLKAIKENVDEVRVDIRELRGLILERAGE